MYTREETILRMNALGRAERPFFFVISHDLEHNLLFELPETGHERMAAFSLPLGGMGEQGNWPPLPERLRFIPSPCSMARYAASFASVRNHLMRGDSYLLNLCVATPVETNLTLRHLFRFARAPYRMLLGPDARVPGVHGRSCVCFSPEPFVTVRGRSISTFPMKGTAPAATPEARDWLETDEKENRESATIVDLMRNDLSMVAADVQVRRYRYISPVKTRGRTILQCSSEISGRLPGRLAFPPGGNPAEAAARRECDRSAQGGHLPGHCGGGGHGAGVLHRDFRFLQRRDLVPPSPSASWKRMKREWCTKAEAASPS